MASTTLLFRVHTRVLATLSVAFLIAVLCLAGSPVAPASTCPAVTEKTAVEAALPIERTRSGLPRTLVRIFFLLPHLIPHDR